MRPFARLLNSAAVCVFALMATEVAAQTANERALILAFQAGDIEQLRTEALAIENGLGAGLPVGSRSVTATFGLLAEVMFAIGDVDETLRYYGLAVQAAADEGVWYDSSGIQVRYEFANTLMLKDRHIEAMPVLLDLANDLKGQKAYAQKPGRDVLVSLVAVYMTFENWEKVEALSREVLAFAESETPPDRYHIKVGSNGAAFALRAMQRPKEAIPFSRKNLELTLEDVPGDGEEALTARLQLAMALEEAAQFTEARTVTEAILADINPTSPELRALEINAKRRLARIQKAEGQYLEFRNTNRDVIEGLVATETGLAKLNALEELANRVLSDGDLDSYQSVLREIVQFVEGTEEVPRERAAAAQVKLAEMAVATRMNFSEAKAFLDPARVTLNDTLGPDHLETIRAEALAMKLRRSEAGMATELRKIGRNLVFSDGGAEAAGYSDADLAILRRLAEAETQSGGRWNGFTHFINLANALGQAGQYQEALAVLDTQDGFDDTARAGTVSLETHLGFMVHESRGLIHLNAGQFDKAVDTFAGGVSELLAMMREMSWASAIGAADEFHRFGQIYGRFYTTAAWHAGNVKTPDELGLIQDHAFKAMQLAGYGPAAASVARSAVRRATGDSGLQSVVAEFEALSRFGAETAAANSGEILEGADDRRAREKRISLLHTEIDARFPEYFGLQIPDTVPLAEILGDASLLDSDEALIAILPMIDLLKDARSISGLVLAVTQDDIAWAELPISFREMSEDISILHHHLDPVERAPDTMAALRAPLASITEDTASVRDPLSAFAFDRAARLHDAFFGHPEISKLIAEKPNWTVVPYGAALAAPFAALITKDPGPSMYRTPSELRQVSWLGHERGLTVVPSVSALKNLRTRLPDTETTLAYFGVGDPMFQGELIASLPTVDAVMAKRGNDRSEGIRSLPRLPGTRREVETLAAFFDAGPDAVGLGASATEDFVRQMNASGDLGRARVVHFATHGLLSGAFDGLGEPALALTPPVSSHDDSPGASDGLLTASEAAQLDLNAEWVILSACDTAGKEGIFGDGLGGLAQGFFSAGAQNLMVSQWRVDDLAAERLTTETIAAAESGLSKAQALRQSMRSLALDPSRDTARISNAHPSIWAPFLLIGGG